MGFENKYHLTIAERYAEGKKIGDAKTPIPNHDNIKAIHSPAKNL